MIQRAIRIGAGAGYSGDRIEPAVELATHGALDYLVFECLAERTIALAQQARQQNPDAGYDPLLTDRMRAVLTLCWQNGVRIVTNMGAANPVAAAERICEIARSLGISGLRIAAITGDDVLKTITESSTLLEDGMSLEALRPRMISANAYLGAKQIADALGGGADIVITGRAADPALFLGPMIHEFGWKMDDWDRLGQGTLAGHLLECAGQVTGGYFADPGFKDVPGLASLGFPIGEISTDGTLILTKLTGSGGCITAATVKEQLLYEIHDPARYLQPDVIADFSNVEIEEISPDRVKVTGARGIPKSGLLKTSIGYRDSCIGEGQISYAGPGSLERGALALEIVRSRLELTGIKTDEIRFDLIGLNAIHGNVLSGNQAPYEVRLRVAGRTQTMDQAIRIGNEVETLYTNGPAGGGGAWKSAREIIAIASALLPESAVTPQIAFLEC